MDDIQYILKPDWIKLEDIQKCMYRAHEPNRKKGVVMQNQFLCIEDFEKLYKDALCFVALRGNAVIGTCSYKVVNINTWWKKGKVIYNFGDAIEPEYRGTKVYFKLQELRSKSINESGIRIIQSDTAENNLMVQKISHVKGGKVVKFHSFKDVPYYSVVMVRWLDGCPYSDRYIHFRFKLSKFLTKLVFKPGRKVRLKFW